MEGNQVFSFVHSPIRQQVCTEKISQQEDSRNEGKKNRDYPKINKNDEKPVLKKVTNFPKGGRGRWE